MALCFFLLYLQLITVSEFLGTFSTHKQTHSHTRASTGNHTNARILLEQSKLEILWSLDPGAGHIQLVGHGYLRSHPDCSAVFSAWH